MFCGLYSITDWQAGTFTDELSSSIILGHGYTFYHITSDFTKCFSDCGKTDPMIKPESFNSKFNTTVFYPLSGVMTILCVDLGTDMWPAVALAYEKAESDVMNRPPCSSMSLVSPKMMRLAYGHLGLIETAAGMFAYFVVMAEYGFYPLILFGKISVFIETGFTMQLQGT